MNECRLPATLHTPVEIIDQPDHMDTLAWLDKISWSDISYLMESNNHVPLSVSCQGSDCELKTNFYMRDADALDNTPATVPQIVGSARN